MLSLGSEYMKSALEAGTLPRIPLEAAAACVVTSSCRGHIDELATEPFLLLHGEHGTGYRQS